MSTKQLVVDRTVRYESVGAGRLKIYTTTVGGTVVGEAFTLESLCEVLDMPMSTLEGRYKRGRLQAWKVDIPTYAGRPSRGFPLALFERVVGIITTPGAFVKTEGDGDSVSRQSKPATGALIPTMYQGKRHYTIPALAEAYHRSETSIRKKLERCNLLRKMVNLDPPKYGGRPKRGFPESVMAAVNMALVDGTPFLSEMDRVLARATGQYDQSKRDVMAMVPDDVKQATDHGVAMRSVLPKPHTENPVNRVNRETEESIDTLMEEINELMKTAVVSPMPGGAPVHPVNRPFSLSDVAGVHVKAETIPSPVDDTYIEGKLPLDELIEAARVQWHTMLVERPAMRPDEEDFDDAYMQMTDYAGIPDDKAREIVDQIKSHWERRKQQGGLV